LPTGVSLTIHFAEILGFCSGPPLAGIHREARQSAAPDEAIDNTLYVSLSRQMVLRREFDLLANNIANVDTAGFKVESLMLAEDAERPRASARSMERPITFVADAGVGRDFGQGSLKPTGAPFDLAISGDGFFQVSTAQGDRFTRDGRFAMDADGRLVTAAGDPVMSSEGSEIVLDARLGAPHIAGDGSVSQDGQVLGRVGVFRFANLGALSKTGDNLYSNTAQLPPEQANDARVVQGSIEGSNVPAILQMTRLIEVSRAYESAAKMMAQVQDLSSQSIQRLGKIQ
jgi:flagellar basal-body rod protein FlgF